MRPSYLYDGSPYNDKIAPLYLDSPQVTSAQGACYTKGRPHEISQLILEKCFAIQYIFI